jgi:IS1 family transposase
MVSHLFFYQLMFLGLLWLCVLRHDAWPNECAGGDQRPSKSLPSRKRSSDPKPFPGLTRKPPCAACEQAHEHGLQPPGCPPPRIVPTRGRPRQVDTSFHFCPHATCAYRGWVSWGNLSANGHPSGGPWRQWYCTVCKGYFLETHGPLLHGKRVAPDVLVWAVGALAEGLGIRAVARVFEVDPHTVLQWLVEAAEQLQAFSQYFLHDVRVTQVQLDELYALLSAVQAGEVSEAEALTRLSRSPHWVWAALDPVTKLLLTIDVGDRTLAMAQRVVHQVVQVLAPGCVPLFLTDGFTEYTTALLTHYGQWVQPARRRAQGPMPKPRWMPRPQLLYAQVIKTVRRRRLVRVCHRVVFGTVEAVHQVLAAHGWQINTAFIERLNLSMRQHVAAVGRRVTT